MHINPPSEEFILAAPLFGALMPDPNAVVKDRLKPLRPQCDELPLVSNWLFSVRGLKCLQRQVLMFCRICLKSGEEVEVCDDESGKGVLLWEELSERGGEAAKSPSMWESRLWKILSRSEWARSRSTLYTTQKNDMFRQKKIWMLVRW